MKFFKVSDNSPDMPWYASIESIVSGRNFKAPVACQLCKRPGPVLSEHLVARLNREKCEWPDWLDVGGPPSIILSERVLEAWKVDGIGEFPCHELMIEQPVPGILKKKPQPRYFWIDNEDIVGVELDWIASSFIDVWSCVRCRTIANWDSDLSLWHKQRTPWIFVEGSWNGLHLFTVDSLGYVFCTEDLVRSVARHKFTNFRFVPVEEGDGAGVEGIDYLKLYGNS